jgi:hypothetical protein
MTESIKLEFEGLKKEQVDDTTWYILKLKKQYDCTEVYKKDSLSEECMKELNSIRTSIVDNLCNNESLFSKKPSQTSLMKITLPFYTLPEKTWSPVVKWVEKELVNVFRLHLVSVYISRSMILPLFKCTPYSIDTIDFEWSSSIHPDLEEFEFDSSAAEEGGLTLRNLKKEREMAKTHVKELFKAAHEAEEEFVRKYGDLDDDESTFSDSNSEYSSD